MGSKDPYVEVVEIVAKEFDVLASNRPVIMELRAFIMKFELYKMNIGMLGPFGRIGGGVIVLWCSSIICAIFILHSLVPCLLIGAEREMVSQG